MYVQKRLSPIVLQNQLAQKQQIECYLCNKSFDFDFDYIKHKMIHTKKELKFNEAANVLFR